MRQELCCLLTFRLAHRAENARFCDPAEIGFDRWNLAGSGHVDAKRLGQAIPMGKCARPAVIRLKDHIDRKRDAVREESLAAVAIECHQRIPQIGRLLRREQSRSNRAPARQR